MQHHYFAHHAQTSAFSGASFPGPPLDAAKVCDTLPVFQLYVSPRRRLRSHLPAKEMRVAMTGAAYRGFPPFAGRHTSPRRHESRYRRNLFV